MTRFRRTSSRVGGTGIGPWVLLNGIMMMMMMTMRSAQASIDQAGFGYTATTDVSSILKLAWDVRDIQAGYANSAIQLDIYVNGSNAKPLTLQALSTDSQKYYGNYSIYNLYKYGFDRLGSNKEKDEEGNFDGDPVEQYANTLVLDLFQLNRLHIKAEATLVLNVAMAFWGSLFSVLDACQRADDQTKGVMLTQLDTAAAFWVGQDQTKGSSSKGYMLYNLAEFFADKFGQGTGGEAPVNTLVLASLAQLQEYANSDYCISDDSAYQVVRTLIKDLVFLTNVVLVQGLLHKMVEVVDNGDISDFVELYSLALLPQVVTCDEGLYNQLILLTISNDVTSATEDQVIKAIRSAYSCLGITCEDVGAYEQARIPQCDDSPEAGLPALAGYQPEEDVRQDSYIDRDIRQMDVIMRYGAWAAATDYYKYGWNSETSLQNLATTPTLNQETTIINSYAQTQNLADDIILAALQGSDPFTSATMYQRAALVTSAATALILYPAALASFDDALRECEQQSSVSTMRTYWDIGVAYVVGSMEGSSPGGQQGGQSLFALSKELCVEFSDCEDGSSVVNNALIDSFTLGTTYLTPNSTQCEALSNLLFAKIRRSMLVPLMQGMIDSAAVAAQNSTLEAAALALTYSRPVVAEMDTDGDPTSASTIDSSVKFFYITPTLNMETVISAVRTGITSLQTNCIEMGSYIVSGQIYGFCSGDVAAPGSAAPSSASAQPSTSPSGVGMPTIFFSPGPAFLFPSATPPVLAPTSGNDIAWGRFAFSNETLAEDVSKFALDVQAMYRAANESAAMLTYNSTSVNAMNGLYSGDVNVSIRSLQEFSTKALQTMALDPMFNYFRAALYDDETLEDPLDETFNYADLVVQLALNPKHGNSTQLAAEAVVVMSVWMEIVHLMYEAQRVCQSAKDPALLIDSAVALWIGQGQQEGKYDSGYMMYANSQAAAELFGIPEAETAVNTNLMTLFVVAQDLGSQCPGGSSIYQEFRRTVDEMIRFLTIPIVQHLLYHMSEDDLQYVELYALGFIPQAESCNQAPFSYLRDSLFEGFKRDTSINNQLIKVLSTVLHCLRISCDNLGDISNASPNLQNIVTLICSELATDFGSNSSLIGGFQTNGSVAELARIDLDIQQIDVLMRTRAYDTAFDLYNFGRNSLDENDNYVSLRSLAQGNRSTAGDIFQQFAQYFKSSLYADELVEDAILNRQNGRFAGASRLQLAHVARRTFQSMIVFMQVLALFGKSVTECSNANQESLIAIDQGVALFVGSIEGPDAGGDPDSEGLMMFALAKEFCERFGVCDTQGAATTNEFLMFAFSDLKNAIDAADCESAESIYLADIAPMMVVPLIQATLYYAVVNDKLPAGSENETALADGDILAKSVLPLVSAINVSSAALIGRNMEFNLTQKPVIDGPANVFRAFGSVLTGLGIGCKDVGTLQSNSMSPCSTANGTIAANTTGPEIAPPSDTSTSLGNSLYVATTYVQDRANIALDVKDMESALSSGGQQLAQVIYESGKNSDVFNNFGVKIGLRSLKMFSTNASETMQFNPLYHITVYALSDESGNFMGKSAAVYADTIVQQAFATGAQSRSTLAAEAAVALNLWMELSNELYATATNCEARTLLDQDGVHSIDEAAAYWIGDGQVGGDAENGHLLYALAENMGQQFNLNGSGQSRTNVNIIRLLNQAKLELSLPNACEQNYQTAPRIRRLVDQIASVMVVVLMQALINYLRVGDRDRVNIYAHAFVPLTAACSPTTFKYLRAQLLSGPYNEVVLEDIITSIRSTLSCFGLSCADVGIHKTEGASECVDSTGVTSLGGYKTAGDAQEYSRIDLDILELDILMQRGAYEAAEDLYLYGKHVAIGAARDSTALSLSSLATSSGRSAVAQYEAFSRYFNNDVKYADSMVQNAIKTSTYTASQRRLVAVGVCRYMVMYMATLQTLNDAVTACRPGSGQSQASSSASWDKAAAFITGSLSGNSEDDADEGLLIWSLAQQNCAFFGTCSASVPGASKVNDRIITLLYSGRGAILGGSCDQLRVVSQEVGSILLVPLIQSTLLSSAELAPGTVPPISDENRTNAYVYAMSILPLVADADSAAAATIQANFQLGGTPARDVEYTTSAAFSKVLSQLNVDCNQVGSTQEIDTCTGDVHKEKKTGMIVGVIIGFLTLVAIVFLLRAKRVLKRKPKEEDPVFVTPTGEFNHDTSEQLLPPPQESARGDAETDVLKDADADADENDDDDDDYGDDHHSNGKLQVV